MKKLVPFAVIALLIVIIASTCTFVLDEIEQAVVVQFGKPVGTTIVTPGLKFKKPFIQEIRRFDKRLLTWDGDPNEIPTLGRQFISVDTSARWRIVDPQLFMTSVKGENGAHARLDNIINSVVRDKISSNQLNEIVRSQRLKIEGEPVDISGFSEDQIELLQKDIKVGREQIERQILLEANKQMPQFGIEIVDVLIKRLNYVATVQQQVFRRMIAERERIAAKFRSEGEGEAAEITGRMKRELAEIQSDAERQASVIRGQGDAGAIKIYNDAYSIDPDFFAFYRTLESYVKSVGEESTLVIGMDSDYFKFLRQIRPDTPDSQ